MGMVGRCYFLAAVPLALHKNPLLVASPVVCLGDSDWFDYRLS